MQVEIQVHHDQQSDDDVSSIFFKWFFQKSRSRFVTNHTYIYTERERERESARERALLGTFHNGGLGCRPRTNREMMMSVHSQKQKV